MPIYLRPEITAAIPVVELPQNGSKIRAFSKVDDSIIRRKRFSGF